MSQQTAVDHAWVFRRLHHKLMEARRASKKHLRFLAEMVGRVGCLGKILLRQFSQPNTPVNSHKNIRHQRDERLVRTNIRRRLLWPDVLLPRGQGQYKTAVPVLVGGLSCQTARQDRKSTR